jgi:predicted amidophosphoribosyltransferase
MSTETGPPSRSELLRAATALVFPSRCVACGVRPVEAIRIGGVCRPCWEALPAPPDARCGVCDDPLPAADAGICGRCLLDPPPFRTLRAAAPYRGSARAMLIAFKFRGAHFLAPHLARLMAGSIPEPRGYGEVVPVPATAFSRLRRDHPAEVLAHALARRLAAPFAARRLSKVRATRRQSGLPARRRAGNVAGAFAARPGAPARVLLVDDVATSGATARECSRALLQAGAREVDVWCFARASRDDEVAETAQMAPSEAGGRGRRA